MISSPQKDVQPILFSFDTYELLQGALEEAEKSYNSRTIEAAFHKSRINSYKAKAEQHQQRLDQLNDPNFEEEDDIPMEEVAVTKD